MKTMTITELHAKLEAAGCGQGAEIRRHTAKQHGHQGDVYVHPIKSRPDCWNVETTDQSRQVAVGAEEGSNHRAMGKVQVFWPDSAEHAAQACPLNGFFKSDEAAKRVCIGPVIVADAEWTLTHPKHAHHVFPAGTYLITYQLDRRTMRQVRD